MIARRAPRRDVADGPMAAAFFRALVERTERSDDPSETITIPTCRAPAGELRKVLAAIERARRERPRDRRK
jgi:hypothetical protein